jgi:multidrug efflux pump subunit AcrB
MQKEESSFWKSLYTLFNLILSFLLRFKWLSLIVMVGAILFGTVIMIKQTKFQMFPEFDVQQVYINGKVNINNELKDTEVFVSRVEDALMARLDKQTMDSITSIVGFRMNADMTTDIGDNLFQIISIVRI